MYEVREINEETGKVTHVWFQIKTYEEALRAILKRCFGDNYGHEKNTWTGVDHWYGNDSYGLWGVYGNKMIFEFVNEIGPETVLVYEIGVA